MDLLIMNTSDKVVKLVSCLVLYVISHEIILLIVCLFIWVFFSSHSWNVHFVGDTSIIGEGLQFLIYYRHLWPLSSEVLKRAITTVVRANHL